MREAVDGSAHVLLGGRTVGELTFAAGGCTFRYTDDLLDPDHRVLGQVFEEEPRRLHREPIGLPAWFANLLPERGSGLRRYYAARFGEREVDDARLLLTLGHDLPGAATVVPVDVPREGVLVEAVAARLDQAGVHLSALAGAQPKMSVQRDGRRLTLPGEGETGDWIVKLSGGAFPLLAENEHLMMTWAAEAGLDVPEVDLLAAADVPRIFDTPFGPGAMAFLVKRFDRRAGGERVHIEDLAQVTDRVPALYDRDATYDGIGALVRALTDEVGFDEYLRRLVAMVIMGNGDAHLKNWSLCYPDGRIPALAPAYDLVCTTVYRGLPARLTFPLAGQTRPNSVGTIELVRLAEAAGHPEERALDVVHDTAERLRTSWPSLRGETPHRELVTHVDRRLERHPLTAVRRP